MAIVRSQASDVAALANWMMSNAVPNIFKSVTYESSVLTATDDNDNVVLEIKGGDGSASSGFFRTYRGENNYLGFNLNLFPVTTVFDIIGCDNGFMFEAHVRNASGSERLFACLIAKTQTGKVAIVYPATPPTTTSSPQHYTTGLNHVAFGDSPSMSTVTTFSPESGSQTGLMSFITNAELNTASYTPKAFYVPAHNGYGTGMGTFILNGEEFITNGYWAISCSTT